MEQTPTRICIQSNEGFHRVRNCFKCIEMCVMSDNYFSSISGLPPAPYPECQPSQTTLEQNSPEYLMLLA